MTKPLDQAPEHIKLAVDLILLLEQHQIKANTVLAALEIVKDDYIKKHNNDKLLQESLGGNPSSHIPAHTS